MKNLFMLLFLLILSSCIKENDYSEEINKRIYNCEVMSSRIISDIPEGKTLLAIYNEDTLAISSVPFTLYYPKESVFTRSTNNVDIKYIDSSILSEYSTYSKYWQAIMFEDSENGDYDYNDLVIHIRNVFTIPWNSIVGYQTITLQPIALGSSKMIKLGCILSDFTEIIVSSDVRTDLFESKQGFINTDSSLDKIRYKLDKTIIKDHILPKESNPWISWFIETNGKRFYSVSSDLDYNEYSMIDKKLMPYGLVAYSTFTYPKEKESVFNAYPQFKSWINGSSSSIGSFDKSFTYDSRILWDYLDLN